MDYQNGSATYTYDHASLRVKKVSGGTTTVYIFSGTKVIAEYVNGAAPSAPTREYVDSGQVFAVHQSGTVKYHLRDHLSIRVSVDTSGAINSRHGHYPYGEVWYGQGPRWKFTSYARDDESGLDYAMFRYYNSRLGRFMQVDPLAGHLSSPQSLNRYAYVINNPINLVDPLGMAPGDRLIDPGARALERIGRLEARFARTSGEIICNLNGIATSCSTVFRIALTGQGQSWLGFASTPIGETDCAEPGFDPCVVWPDLSDFPQQNETPPIITITGFEDEESNLSKKVGNCVFEQVGVQTAVGGTAAASGLPVVTKPFVSPGASQTTSVASEIGSKVLPQKLPVRVWAPTLSNLGAKSVVAGRVAGRWVPIVGWALLAYDAVKVAVCISE